MDLVNEQPYITWDCRLRPSSLEASFWRERSRFLAHSDYQTLTRFCLMGFAAVMVSLWPHMGAYLFWTNFWHVGALILLWASCIRCWPGWYQQHRFGLVVLLRVLMPISARSYLDGVRHMVPYIGIHEARPAVTILMKTALPAGCFHNVLESIGMPLPFRWTVLVLVFKAYITLMSSYMQAITQFGNAPKYLQAISRVNSWWVHLTRPTVSIDVPLHKRLEGRSTALFLSHTFAAVGSVVVPLYIAWVNNWVMIRLWLRTKLDTALAQEQQQQQQHDSTADIVCVGDVLLSKEQLMQVLSSPAAAVLIEPFHSGGTSISSATALCSHAIIVGVLCQVVTLFSQLYVYQVCPRLMTEAAWHAWYPVAPASS